MAETNYAYLDSGFYNTWRVRLEPLPDFWVDTFSRLHPNGIWYQKTDHEVRAFNEHCRKVTMTEYRRIDAPTELPDGTTISSGGLLFKRPARTLGIAS